MRAASRMVDTFAKPDQMSILIKQHKGVEERCAGAYALQKVVGQALAEAVKEKTGKTMELSGITEEDRKVWTLPTNLFGFIFSIYDYIYLDGRSLIWKEKSSFCAREVQRLSR